MGLCWWVRSQHGWRMTCFNSTTIRPSCSGVPRHVGASNSHWSGPHRQQWCSTSLVGAWPPSIHGRRRDMHNSIRVHVTTVVQSCFAAYSAPNQEHAACIGYFMSCLTDVGACERLLLQLSSCRHARATAAVSSQCCRLPVFYGQEDRPHLSTAQGLTSTGCVSLSVSSVGCVLAYWCHGMAPPYTSRRWPDFCWWQPPSPPVCRLSNSGG